MLEIVKYKYNSNLLTLSCSAGRQKGPALDTVDHEVARRSERRIVESLAGLGPTLVEVSIKPQAELTASCSDHKILAAPLQEWWEAY